MNQNEGSVSEEQPKRRSRKKKEEQVTLEQIEGSGEKVTKEVGENSSFPPSVVAELEARLAQLEAENAKLKEMVPEETESRKVAITLPLSVWNKLDEHLRENNKKQGTFFGELAKSYFQK